MERNAFINGRNIWSTWGAELMDGALEAILTPPPVKDYIENDSRLEHGIQITSSPEICKMDSRELTLPFFITGNSPGMLSAMSAAPWADAMRCTMARPSPAPPCFLLRDLSTM